MQPPPRTVVVAGSSGLIGTALVSALRQRGDTVRRLVRTDRAEPGTVRWAPERGELPDDALDGADAIVNLAGAPVGTRRWTRSYRREIVESRTTSSRLLATRAARLPQRPAIVQASASGFYGDRGTTVLDEADAAGDGFLADVVLAWEAAARPAVDAGVRVAYARSGIVLSPVGGAAQPMMRLLRLGLGGPLGSGRQVWSWITLHDEVRALIHLLDSEVSGPVNLVTPHAATNRDLTRALAAQMHRPALVPAPSAALRLVLGGFADEILASRHVLPRVLETDGFHFDHPRVDDACAWLIRG